MYLGAGALFSHPVAEYTVSQGSIDTKFLHFRAQAALALFQWAKERRESSRQSSLYAFVPFNCRKAALKVYIYHACTYWLV